MKLQELFNRYLIPLLKKYGDAYSHEQKSALWDICNCRTPALGNIVFCCPDCGERHFSPHSCGNRNCPQCHHHTTEKWFHRQQQKLLPVPYFLITFTVPFELRSVIYPRQKTAFNLMFRAVEQTLTTISADSHYLGASPGFTAVLHTHSRRLDFHPHIHVVFAGGGIRGNQWTPAPSDDFMFPFGVLKKLFRGILLSLLKSHNFLFDSSVYDREWSVNITPSGNGEPALKYLSRYLNRGIIQDKNILGDDNEIVTFKFFDSTEIQWKKRSLPAVEFLNLVLTHVLPKGFRRVRDYGFLHGNAKKTLLQIQLLLHAAPSLSKPPAPSRPVCEKCNCPMTIVACKVFYSISNSRPLRGPP